MRTPPDETERQHRAIFLLIALLAMADRLVVLFSYGLRYTGTDDVVFWSVAADLSRGIFREPFLYGQNYNLAIESLAAVPLLWLQVPMQVAMPIATALLAIAPFAAWAWWHARRGEWWLATLFVAVPVLMPVEWGLITSMTRGFVNGMAVTALLPLCLLIRSPVWQSVAIGATLLTALAANPASLLFCLPFSIAYAFSNGKAWRRITAMIAGALPIAVLWLLALSFYEAHPERVLHGGQEWLYTFHPFELIPEALVRLDRFMRWICPVWWFNGHVILYLLSAVCVVLFIGRKRANAWAVLVTLITIFIALGFPKIGFSSDHILFPYTRMFLALPVLLAWSVAAIAWRPAVALRSAQALLLMACMLFAWKAATVEKVIADQLGTSRGLPVEAVSVADLRADAAYVAELARREKLGIMVQVWGEHAHRGLVLSYAGPLIQPGFPETVIIGSDRRYWLRSGLHDAVFPGMLFICGDDYRWGDNAHKLPTFRTVPFTFGKARLIHGSTVPLGAIARGLEFRLDEKQPF